MLSCSPLSLLSYRSGRATGTTGSMNAQNHHRRAIAIIGCAASFAVPAVAASTASAAGLTACPSKEIAVKTAGDIRTLHIKAQAISAQGESCAAAYKLIAEALEGKTQTGWKSVNVKFTTPSGTIPQEVRSGAKIVRYAIHPG